MHWRSIGGPANLLCHHNLELVSSSIHREGYSLLFHMRMVPWIFTLSSSTSSYHFPLVILFLAALDSASCEVLLFVISWLPSFYCMLMMGSSWDYLLCNFVGPFATSPFLLFLGGTWWFRGAPVVWLSLGYYWSKAPSRGVAFFSPDDLTWTRYACYPSYNLVDLCDLFSCEGGLFKSHPCGRIRLHPADFLSLFWGWVIFWLM